MNDLQDLRDEVTQLRVPPHSVEAEQSVLGALLNDNSVWDRAADLLAEADFYRHDHKLIYTALGKLINSNKAADVVTVFDLLTAQVEAKEFGGLVYLNDLAQSVPSAANVRRYAEIVRGRALLRSVISKVDEAHSIALGAGDVSQKLDQIGALFAGIEARNSSRMPRPMSEVMVKVVDNINAAEEGAQKGWSTGIHGIDWRLNGGMKAGKLIVLAARPAVGKTSLSGQILQRVAKDGEPCLMLSQEMEFDEVGERALANDARVDYSSIQTGKLSDEEWSRVSEGVDVLGHLPLWIDDEPGLNLRAINAKARSVKKLSVLVVDYIQLSEGEGDTRSAQVGSITRGLKKLAKQLGICVIALSQLNREVDKRPGRRPQMSDLRDSGEIEQDADTVLFLWPILESEDGAEIRHIGCDVAKNRKGRKGAFVLTFDGAKQRWGESTQTVESFQSAKKGKGNFE